MNIFRYWYYLWPGPLWTEGGPTNTDRQLRRFIMKRNRDFFWEEVGAFFMDIVDTAAYVLTLGRYRL